MREAVHWVTMLSKAMGMPQIPSSTLAALKDMQPHHRLVSDSAAASMSQRARSASPRRAHAVSEPVSFTRMPSPHLHDEDHALSSVFGCGGKLHLSPSSSFNNSKQSPSSNSHHHYPLSPLSSISSSYTTTTFL